MQYVYILESKSDGNLYIGCTNDLQRRITLHNSKKVESTKHRTPFTLIHYEAYLSEKDAFERERYLKTGWGKQFIKKNLENYFLTKNLGG